MTEIVTMCVMAKYGAGVKNNVEFLHHNPETTYYNGFLKHLNKQII